jgi:UDP-N-acetylglucosamine 2-epimerase (non-hydrolysing)
MSTSQSLEQVSSRVLLGLEEIFEKNRPDLVIVQGDTATALMGALAAFYKKIPVAHIEAGLRTDNKYNPFPEEINRRLITQLADYNFAPTELAAENLRRSGVAEDAIFITGNTVIDALLWVIDQKHPFEDEFLQNFDFAGKRTVLVTTHRRENIGDGLNAIYSAISRLTKEFDDVEFIFPVHLNPVVQEQAKKALGKNDRVHLINPLGYSDLANLMNASYMVMTDSGGIQEEAPALGKPVLVLRDTTERPEGIDAGTAELVGTDEEAIFKKAKQLLGNQTEYIKMAQATNPYGDGTASKQIVDILTERLS